MNLRPTTPAWAEVSLKALRRNAGNLSRLARPAGLIAVVKANAYGHGLVEASKAFLAGGAKRLAVAFVQEGVALRKAGIRCPIIVLTPTLAGEIPTLLKNNLTPQVSSFEGAKALSLAAKKLGVKTVKVHVKVDTGMGRVGFQAWEIRRTIDRILSLPCLKIEAFYTHLATADWADPAYASEQIAAFKNTFEKMKSLFPGEPEDLNAHVANSAALLTNFFPKAKGGWVRPGLALYGIYPNERLRSRVALIPAMQLKSRIIHLKDLDKGRSVSYGRTFFTKAGTKVATLGIGYADGLLRSLSNKGACLVRGKRVPLVGTVCMDMTMADVSKVPGVQVGDTATLFGRDGQAVLPVEEQAALAGTISYELLCAVGERVPRIYK
jgi:alanine racemase